MKALQYLLILSLLATPAASLTQKVVSRDMDVTKINELPMIYAHDAGTGMMDDFDLVTAPDDYFISKAAKTQEGSLVDLARCGARAFDIRPYVQSDGLVVTHHGTAVVRDVSIESEVRRS